MRKNVASQNIAAQMNSRSDGSPLTTGVSVYYTGDGGTQTSGGGTLTHKGNGHWNYAPTQGETNFAHVAFTFIHATGVNVTINVYPVAYDPGDTVRLGLTALPNAAADAAGGLPISDAGGLDLDTLLDAAISSRATPAQVNSEVVDALATDTYAEPGQEAPGATISLSAKIGYLYKALRNKITNDGSTIKIYADDGSTVDHKSTISEAAGTVTRDELVTGP